MAISKMMSGCPVLMGDNTIPGVRIPKEVQEQIPTILDAVREYGCDYYDPIIEFLTYDEISEVAAYGGFPVRYPHWRFGMEYEELSKGYEYGQHRIYEMVINCLDPCTVVLTQQGSKRAGDVVAGDVLFAGTGPRDVVAVVEQPESEVFSVVLDEFATSTVCTEGHKWKCLRDGKSQWVETKDLVEGDLVFAGGRYADFQGVPAVFDWNRDAVQERTFHTVRNRVQKVTSPASMTLELAELLGAITGDGSNGVRLAENIVSVSVWNQQPQYRDHLVELFRSVFVLEPKIQHKKSTDLVHICRKEAVDFLDYLGLSRGCTYRDKRIPWSVWASSHEYRAAYLRGMFDTDGYVGAYLSISAYNPDLAADIQRMLLEMGIRSKVTRVDNKHNNISVVVIKGTDNVRRFREYIGFSLAYKQERLDRLVDKGYNRGGFVVKDLLDAVYTMLESIDRLPRWAYLFLHRKGEVKSNTLMRVCRDLCDHGYDQFKEIADILSVPMYAVSRVDKLPDKQVTIDIALAHDEHDFLANGLWSHNTNPCYIYCLDSNTLVDNVTVIAHALGHSDFFKNNVHFQPTNTNMLNKMANHGTRIREYMATWGKEKVTEFIDYVLRIETLIDPIQGWSKKKYKDPLIKDKRNYRFPSRRDVGDHEYMEDWLNPKREQDRKWAKIRSQEAMDEIGAFGKPEKDIFKFIKDHAPLKPWQQDITSMLYEESLYFQPQRMTKVANEGWASTIDSKIMADMGLISLGQDHESGGIIEYSSHKMGVLGGKYSMNPYKLGYCLFEDIEDRWNKGKFGREWEECDDQRLKEKWDQKLGLGKEKIFEVRQGYNDWMMISEFFTREFCQKYEFFEWQKFPNGEYKITKGADEWESIRDKLVRRHMNGGLPDIRLADDNHLGRGWLCLEHVWDGRMLYDSYVREVMTSLHVLWQNVVVLSTRNKNGDEFVYVCENEDPSKVYIADRKSYDKHIDKYSEIKRD